MTTYKLENDFIAVVESMIDGDVLDMDKNTVSLQKPIKLAKDITIINGSFTNSIESLVIEKHKTLKLRHVKFENSIKTAIVSSNFGSLEASNCIFSGNKGGKGGAIRIGYGGDLSLTDCTFDNNDGNELCTIENRGFSGGAIATGGANIIEISKCKFRNNVGFNGGAIYAIFSKLVINESEFINNEATGEGGGGLFVDGLTPATNYNQPLGGYCLVKDCLFDGNTCKGYGGAAQVYGYHNDHTIFYNCVMRNNKAWDGEKFKGRGGALYNCAKTDVIDCSIYNNFAENQGGAVWTIGKEHNYVNCTVYNNSCQKDSGGGLFLSNTTTNLKNCTIAHNKCSNVSGGVHYSRSQAVNYDHCIVANNIAKFSYAMNNATQGLDNPESNNIEYPRNQNRSKRLSSHSLVIDPKLGELICIQGKYILGTSHDSGAKPTTTEWNLENNTQWIKGKEKAFTLTGGNTPNIIVSGYAKDTIIAGTSYNILVGQAGVETYVFTKFVENGSYIVDFNKGETIDLKEVFNSDRFTGDKKKYIAIARIGETNRRTISIKHDGKNFAPFIVVNGEVSLENIIVQ